MDNRPPLSLRALTERIENQFILQESVPETDIDQTIQGKIVVLSPVVDDELGVIRRFLDDVSRGDDILLRTSPLQYFIPRHGMTNNVLLGEDGILLPNGVTAEDQDCLGIHPSRCFVWEVAPEVPNNAPDELALAVARTALLTIERHPALTVFVVTDVRTANNFMKSVRKNGGAAMRLEQRADG